MTIIIKKILKFELLLELLFFKKIIFDIIFSNQYYIYF